MEKGMRAFDTNVLKVVERRFTERRLATALQ